MDIIKPPLYSFLPEMALLEKTVSNYIETINFVGNDPRTVTTHLITLDDLTNLLWYNNHWCFKSDITSHLYTFSSRRHARVFIKRNKGLLLIATRVLISAPIKEVNVKMTFTYDEGHP